MSSSGPPSPKPSNSVLVDPTEPMKHMVGYVVEPIPNRITSDVIIVYHLLYDRLKELIKRGAVSKRQIDFSFSYLELTQILAANSQYDYTIKPKTKAAYVEDMEQFIFSGEGIITPHELKAQADVQSLESADSDDAEAHPEWFYPNGKRKPAHLIDEETYATLVRKIYEIYVKSHGKLTLESMSAMSKFSEMDFNTILRHNGETSLFGVNGKTKSKASMAAEIHKMVLDKKLKGWDKLKEEGDKAEEKAKLKKEKERKEDDKVESSTEEEDKASNATGRKRGGATGRGRGGRGGRGARGGRGRGRGRSARTSKNGAEDTESDEGDGSESSEEEKTAPSVRGGRAAVKVRPVVTIPPKPPARPKVSKVLLSPIRTANNNNNNKRPPPPDTSHTPAVTSNGGSHTHPPKKPKILESPPPFDPADPLAFPPAPHPTIPFQTKTEEPFASFTPAESSHPFSSPIQRTFPSTIIPPSSSTSTTAGGALDALASAFASSPKSRHHSHSHNKHKEKGPDDKHSHHHSGDDKKPKLKLQILGDGFNRFFLAPESTKFRSLVSKLYTSMPAAQAAASRGERKKIVLSFNGVDLGEDDCPGDLGIATESVIRVKLI